MVPVGPGGITVEYSMADPCGCLRPFDSIRCNVPRLRAEEVAVLDLYPSCFEEESAPAVQTGRLDPQYLLLPRSNVDHCAGLNVNV